MYVCVYIYIYIYLVRHGNRQDVFIVSVVDNIQHLLMLSVVFVSFSFYGFRRRRKRFLMVSVFVFFFVMVSVVAGKRFFMVSVAGFLVDSAAAGGSNILECIERFLVVCLCVFRIGFRRCFLMVSVRFVYVFGYVF